jgi:hypothetical protein
MIEPSLNGPSYSRYNTAARALPAEALATVTSVRRSARFAQSDSVRGISGLIKCSGRHGPTFSEEGYSVRIGKKIV